MKKHKRAAKPAAKSNSIPIPVKVISIIYFIEAGIALLLTIFMLLSLIFVSEQTASVRSTIILILLIAVPAGILYLILGRALRKGNNWARIVVIVLAFVGVFGNGYALLFSMTSSIVLAFLLVAANVLIIYYLMRKDIVQFFK